MNNGARQEVHDLALYVRGLGTGSKDYRLLNVADWLDRLEGQVCKQGYIGCRGGETCTSDHK